MNKYIASFFKITGFDLQTHLSNMQVYLVQYSNTINAFLDGGLYLQAQDLFIINEQALTLFSKNRTSLLNTAYFNLLAIVEDIDTQLSTILQAKKWVRSFTSDSGLTIDPQFQYVLKQNESLQRVSKDILNSLTYIDDEFTLGYNNALTEEMYSSEGGTEISLPISQVNGALTFNIDSIVDTIDPISVLGKDINISIQFENGDLDTVIGLDCAFQSANTLNTLKRGDNPERLDRGLQTELFVGTSSAAFSYPLLIKQIIQNFNGDDSFVNLQIQNIEKQDDGVYLTYTMQTRNNEVVTQTMVI